MFKFMNLHNLLKMDSVNDNNAGGGAGSQQQQSQQGQQTNQTAAQQNGNNNQQQSQQQGSQNQQGQNNQSQQNQTQQQQTERSASGYSQEDDLESSSSGYTASGAAEDKNQQQQQDKSIKLQYKLDLEGVDDFGKKIIEEYAATHKLTQPQAQALVDLKKAEDKAFSESLSKAQSEKQEQIKKTKGEWFNKLKSDKEFGGNGDSKVFWQNMKQVDRVIEKALPGTKSLLDKNKNTLPPEVVLDLYNLSKTLLANDKFVGGEGNTSQDPNDDSVWLNDWYNKK